MVDWMVSFYLNNLIFNLIQILQDQLSPKVAVSQSLKTTERYIIHHTTSNSIVEQSDVVVIDNNLTIIST